jgi:hypothetical protein
MPTSTKTINDLTRTNTVSGSSIIPIYNSGITSSAALSTIYGYLSSGLRSDTTFVSTPATNSVTSEKIVSNSITSEKIVTNAISTEKIQSNAITTEKIANNAISTTKIVDGAITTEKISNNSITSEKISNNSITSEKISNNSITTSKILDSAITTEKIANNSITTSKIANGSITLEKLNDNVVDVNKGLEKTGSGISVKIASGGGIQFNASGELKLIPPAESSTVVVVRPSADGATDAFVGRNAQNGELKPYFKTLIVAANWARQNLTGNVTIFVDEDTIEGSGGQANSWGLADYNSIAVYITQAKIDTITCLKGKGFKEGIYVWAKDTSKPLFGQLYWNNGLSNSTKASTTYIRPRYFRGGGIWSDDRRFTEAPRAINYNVYISNNKSLIAPANSDTANDTHFGSDSNVWSNFTGVENVNVKNFYLRSAMLMEGSKMELRNLNFIQRFNGPDVTSLWIANSSQVWVYNVTVSSLGSANYNYPLVWCGDGSELRIHGTVTLASDEPSTRRYPGYGLAIVGNKPSSINKNLATKAHSIIRSENGGWIRQWDWDPNQRNQSLLTASIILDGDFVINSGIFMEVYWAAKYEGGPVYIQNNLNILADRFNFDSSGFINWYSTNGNLIPFNHNKNCDIRIYHDRSPLRKWTFSDSSIDDTGTVPYGFPSKFNGVDANWGVGTFRNSTGGIASSTSPATTYTLRTTITDVDNFTTAYHFGNLTYPNYPYIESTNLPSLSGFYAFTENGNAKRLNYGASVRD